MKKFLANFMLLFVFMTGGALPAAAQGDTLTVAIVMDVKSFDPQITTAGVYYAVIMHISETLVQMDGDKIMPMLAESWKLLDDKVTYEFTLKQNVKFHNGEIMTADDVVFSLQRALGPLGFGTKGFSMYMAEAGKKDERTVYVKSVAPMGDAFLGSLSHPWASIFNKKHTEALGQDYGLQPVGTGKFKLKSTVPGVRIDMERFDDYHGTPAKLKNLVFRPIVEPASRTIELESGAIDVATELAPVDVGRIQDNPKFEFVGVPSYRLHYLGFDVTKPPYDNLKVRQAINIAMNRTGIIRAVFMNMAVPARGVLPPTIAYSAYNDRPDIEYNPAKAKQLLAEAGYPNGFSGTLMAGERYDYQNVATVVQANLKEIGIDMRIQILEGGATLEAMRAPKHDPFINNWGGQVPTSDPFFYLNTQYHSAIIGETNRAYYSNPEVDKLLEDAVQAQNPEDRASLYAQIWDILERDLPHASLLSPLNLYAKTTNLKGVTFAPTAMTYYSNAYFE